MAFVEENKGIYILYIPTTLTVDSILTIHSCLDKIELSTGAAALIITSKHEKIFNAGMDLKFILQNGLTSTMKIAQETMKLSARLLEFPIPTIGALNGHTIAAGFFIAISLDFRVMAKGQSTLKLIELHMGLVIPRGACALMFTKLHPIVYRDLVIRGLIYNPQTAFDNNIVDFLVPKEELMSKALEIAQSVMFNGENRAVYSQAKKNSYERAIRLCTEAVYDQEFIDAILNTGKPKI